MFSIILTVTARPTSGPSPERGGSGLRFDHTPRLPDLRHSRMGKSLRNQAKQTLAGDVGSAGRDTDGCGIENDTRTLYVGHRAR